MASQTPPCGGGAVLVGTGAALQHVPTASTVACGQSEHCPVPYAPKPNPKLLARPLKPYKCTARLFRM